VDSNLALTLIQANLAVEAVMLGLVGVIYSVYAQYADQVDEHTGVRASVLKPLRKAAWVCIVLGGYVGLCTLLALLWLLADNGNQRLLGPIIVVMFFVEVAVTPLAGAFLVNRFFR
jgi:hypothetical protein